eukprot:16585_1
MTLASPFIFTFVFALVFAAALPSSSYSTWMEPAPPKLAMEIKSNHDGDPIMRQLFNPTTDPTIHPAIHPTNDPLLDQIMALPRGTKQISPKQTSISSDRNITNINKPSFKTTIVPLSAPISTTVTPGHSLSIDKTTKTVDNGYHSQTETVSSLQWYTIPTITLSIMFFNQSMIIIIIQLKNVKNERIYYMNYLLDVSEYTLHFKSYHFIWNDYNQWTWNTSYSNFINTTIACCKQYSSLCISTQFTTDKETKQIKSLQSMKIYYNDNNIQQNNVILDFWDDLDWSQVNILHHNDMNIDRRQLLRGTLTSKYDTYDEYDEYEYEYDNDNDNDNEFSAHKIDESDIECEC